VSAFGTPLRILDALRQRDSRLPFAGETISQIGDAARAYEPPPAEGLRRELASGCRYVASVPWLWITIRMFSLVVMFGYAAFQALLPKLIEEDVGAASSAFCAAAFLLASTSRLVRSVD
jgi:hypothetical protein